MSENIDGILTIKIIKGKIILKSEIKNIFIDDSKNFL